MLILSHPPIPNGTVGPSTSAQLAVNNRAGARLDRLMFVVPLYA